MERLGKVAALLLLCGATSLGQVESPATLLQRLRRPDATYEDWRPLLALGKRAIPHLKKLLADPSDAVKTRAAVILYRLGERNALDMLDRLLESPVAEARKEAAEALRAFTGGPAPIGPYPNQKARRAALERWRTWWKRNRAECLKRQPCSALFGKVVKIDGDLAVVTLSERHGAKNGMELYARRNGQPVCTMRIVMPSAIGSVARIVKLSVRTPPRPGDLVFWLKP